MIILLILALSVCAGLLLRRLDGLRRFSDATGWTVFALLFVFGITIGMDRNIVSRFSELGLKAMLASIAGVAGSILFAWLFAKFINRNGK